VRWTASSSDVVAALLCSHVKVRLHATARLVRLSTLKKNISQGFVVFGFAALGLCRSCAAWRWTACKQVSTLARFFYPRPPGCKKQEPLRPFTYFEIAAQRAMSQPPFIASASFVGSRAGYAFRQGARGLGYYLDAPAALAVVEAPPAGEGDELNDEAQAQQLVKTLARLSRANMEMRSKHPGDPSKFMASEVALDVRWCALEKGAHRTPARPRMQEHLNKMSLLATRPDLMGGVASALVEELAPLVAHDNDALAKDVVGAWLVLARVLTPRTGLLRELTDPDNYEGEAREAALKLPDTLMDADVPAAIVACIDRAPVIVLEGLFKAPNS